MMAAP